MYTHERVTCLLVLHVVLVLVVFIAAQHCTSLCWQSLTMIFSWAFLLVVHHRVHIIRFHIIRFHNTVPLSGRTHEDVLNTLKSTSTKYS